MPAIFLIFTKYNYFHPGDFGVAQIQAGNLTI